MVQSWQSLRRTGVLGAALVSGLAVALLLARMWVRGNIGFAFLGWNLILAWIPLLVALPIPALLAHRGWRSLAAIPLLAVWLAFLPNAPYLVTDLLHLKARAPIPLWFDATLLCVFAGAGLVLTGAAVHRVWVALEPAVGRASALAVMLAIGPLVGLGIYLGRFLRWNSWDLLTRPIPVLADLAERLFDPMAHPTTWAVTMVGAALTWVAWGVLASLRIEGGRRSAQRS